MLETNQTINEGDDIHGFRGPFVFGRLCETQNVILIDIPIYNRYIIFQDHVRKSSWLNISFVEADNPHTYIIYY